MATAIQIRQKVLSALDRGESNLSIARRLEIGERTVRRIRERRDAGLPNGPSKTGPKGYMKLTDADLALMRKQIAANPGITLVQLRDMLSIEVAESTVHRAIKKMNINFKKVADRCGTTSIRRH